jgi:hypothetical protein
MWFKVSQGKVNETLSQKQAEAWAWWLTTIIPTTWGAKLRRTEVQG